MIKYVIFDKDGTLLDTEPFFAHTWISVGEKWGLEGMDENYYPNIAGKSVAKSISFLKETYGEGLDAEGFMNERMSEVHRLMEGDIPLKSGCIEILNFLKEQGIKTAIATSTAANISMRNLKKLGLIDCIDALVTGDMVANGKPAPDIFIECGKRIGAVNEETLVVGDSSFDIIGGFKAGMRPVMVIDHNPPSEEAEPLCYAVFNSLFEVIELIKKENNIL